MNHVAQAIAAMNKRSDTDSPFEVDCTGDENGVDPQQEERRAWKIFNGGAFTGWSLATNIQRWAVS